MSRYLGPARKVSRRVGTILYGLRRRPAEERRPYPPGEHGQRRRRRISDYGLHLVEKQKVRFHYGLTERQMRRLVINSSSKDSPADAVFIALERRLDNAVFRLGLAPSIRAARQLIGHGHIRIGGRKVTVPGQLIRPGDRIEASEAGRRHLLIQECAKRGPELELPSYLKRDADGYGGVCTGLPQRSDVPILVDERLVIEFYAR